MQINSNVQNQTDMTDEFYFNLGVGSKELICVSPDSDLSEAARLMRENRVGDVLVVDSKNGKQIPIGILTDRDLAIESIAQGVSFDQIRVVDIMTSGLTVAKAGTGVFEMIRLMHENGVTRLPIVDQEGSVVGIVTARKLLQCLAQGVTDLCHVSDQQQAKEAQH